MPPNRADTNRSHRTTRATTVAMAVGAALVVWAVARASGIDVQSPQMGATAPAPIGASDVVVASAVASAAGWALLASLERRIASRARTIWLTAAVLVLTVSLGAPLTGDALTAANRIVLVAMHLAVAGVLVPGLLRTETTTDPATRRSGARRSQR